MNQKNKQLQSKLQIKNSDNFSQGFYFIKFLAIVLLVFPSISFAEVYINEIMYDPASGGSEWIEIYNSGNNSVDLSDWRFFNNKDDSSPLRLQKGSAVLVGGGYAVITTTSDWSSFSGVVFSSSQFSLPNDSSKYNTYKAISDSGKQIIDFVTYDTSLGGNKESGNSLQKTNSGWISAVPTPGIINSQVSNSPSTTTIATTTTTTQTQTEETTTNNTSTNSGSSAHSSPSPLSSIENKMEFEISAGRDRLTSVGSSIVFQVTPTKLQNISSNNITYSWSFGDGTSAQGNNLSHTYKFPGEYAVVANALYSDKQAVSRIVVKVANPKIILIRVPGGVEVSNNSGVEINLENWNLVGQTKTFTFPKDTLLPNGKKVVFADEVTGINAGSVRIENPLNKKYAEIVEVPVVTAQVLGVSTSTNSIADEIQKVTKTLAVISSQIKEVNGGVTEYDKSDSLIAVEPKQIVKKEMFVESTSIEDVLVNTATVFEAPTSRSFVNTIFSWPIAGFNFIRGLFVER